MMIHTYEEKYDNQIDNLLKGNQYFFPWDKNVEITLLTIENDKVVAVGSIWKKKVHPYRDYIGIYVEPDYRKKGIGSDLYSKLSSTSRTNKFQAAVYSTDKAAIRFLHKTGFKLARKSYEEKLPHIKFEDKEGIVQYTVLDTYKNTELMKLQLQNYKDTHSKINPLNEKITLPEWVNIITTDLNKEYSFVSINDNSIEAYILCYEGDREDEIEIGYIGGKEENNLENYLPFYKACLSKLFDDFDSVWIEADNVDPYAFAVLNLFDYDKTESFDTYIL